MTTLTREKQKNQRPVAQRESEPQSRESETSASPDRPDRVAQLHTTFGNAAVGRAMAVPGGPPPWIQQSPTLTGAGNAALNAAAHPGPPLGTSPPFTSPLSQQTHQSDATNSHLRPTEHAPQTAPEQTEPQAVADHPDADAADAIAPPPPATPPSAEERNPNRIPAPLRASLEQLSGLDLSDVRVHADSPGPAQLDALAYTQGQDIHLAPGQEKHLPHEGWHAVQQMQGRVSSPHNGTSISEDTRLEREADVMGTRAAHTSPPAPAPRRRKPPTPPGRVIQRQQRERPRLLLPAETALVSRPPILLFPRTTPFDRTWDILPETFVPLARGVFLVDGIPISYHLEGQAYAGTAARLVFGPAWLDEVRVFVTGPQAERIRNPTPFIIPGFPPIVLPGSPPAPYGRFSADAMMRFTASAHAGVVAAASLSGGLGVFADLFNAGAYAGISGSASADANTNVDSYVSFTWNDGVASISTTLDLRVAVTLNFRVDAYAGVWVELRFPDIPVVTDLTHEVQDWPIIGWIVPDLTQWRWRKDYRKDWPLFQKTYDWEMQEHFAIGGSSPGASADGRIDNPTGFDIEQLVRDLIATQRDGQLSDDPEGPGTERRSGDPTAVADARAAALAQISSARRAADRQRRANARLLRQARQAARSAQTQAGSPSLAVGASGPGAPSDTTVEQLEQRGDKLDEAVSATENLRDRADALGAPAAAPDGVSRNQARAGYESIAANADALGDKIDQAEEPFDIPAAAEPDSADYERMRAKMHEAYDAFDEAFDPTRTEKLWADSQVRAAGQSADLAAYRHEAVEYRRRALFLWRRIQQLERDLERASEWYERGDHALGAVVFGELQEKALQIKRDAEAMAADRPVGDWDTEFVELVDGHLMLKPEFRGRATRSTFYPHDYSADTKRRMVEQIGSFRTDGGILYWEYRGRTSPRGDFWWNFDDELERPTLDHTNPTVVRHWNVGGGAYRAGRRVDRAERRRFYDFEGATVVVVPKSLNSSAGGRERESYNPRVFKSFRGR